MTVIGRHLLLIISIVRMTLSDDDIFSKENRSKFLYHIFNLHNKVRIEHGVRKLIRLDDLDKVAFNLLYNKIPSDIEKYYKEYGVNYGMKPYDVNTELDSALAEALFSDWYEKGDNYNYLIEPPNKDADPFTQIVWSGTLYFGAEIAWSKDHYVVIVIYFPPGNEKEKYVNNVIDPSSINKAGPSGSN